MKIAIVTQYFPPDKPGRIADELSQEFAARGHDVRVLTTYPHYDGGQGESVPKDSDHGRVRVRRVPIYGSHTRNPVARIGNYLSFAVSASRATKFFDEADVVYVHGTPATVAHPAHKLYRRRRTPYVYHVQDIWPESVTGSGFLPKPVAKLAAYGIEKWLRAIYADAAAVVAISPSAQQLFVERGADPGRVHLVYNWARESAVAIRPGESSPGAGLRLLYGGNLGPMQDLETVVRAIGAVSDLPDVLLEIAGSGVSEPELRALVGSTGLGERVRFLGRLGPDEMASAYARADFQIVPLKDLDIFASTMPSKVQAGLAHGVPVISTVAGDVSKMIHDQDLGFTAAPEDVEDLAAAIRDAHSTTMSQRVDLRRRARAFYDSNFTLAGAVDRLETIFEAVSPGQAHTPTPRDGEAR